MEEFIKALPFISFAVIVLGYFFICARMYPPKYPCHWCKKLLPEKDLESHWCNQKVAHYGRINKDKLKDKYKTYMR